MKSWGPHALRTCCGRLHSLLRHCTCHCIYQTGQQSRASGCRWEGGALLSGQWTWALPARLTAEATALPAPRREPLRQPSAWRFLCGCSNGMGGGDCQSKPALGGGCDCVHTISTAWPRGYHCFNQVREKLNLLSPQLLLRLHVCVRVRVCQCLAGNRTINAL